MIRTTQRLAPVLGMVLCALLSMTAAMMIAPVRSGAVTASSCVPASPTSCTLRELATLNGIRIGATAEASETTDADHAATLAREFDSVTPENAMKWYATQADPGVWTFTDADTVVAHAAAHDMEVRGHTLVWAQDSYTPAWVRAISDPAVLRAAVETQITTTMNHFRGSVHRWDVVNEPLASLGTGRSTSVFWSLGDDWIAEAFALAHSIDPTAELWLNEYGSDWVPGKHEALMALVRELIDRGVPIDGVGLQTHRLPGDPIDAARFTAQLTDFTSLGLQVAITELDVPVSPTDPDAFARQAVEYGAITAACLSVRGCTEITIWGVSDGSTWLDALGVFPTPTRPLLFDTAFQPKPAYEAVRAALAAPLVAASPVVDTSPPTSSPEILPITGAETTAAATVAFLLIGLGLLLRRSAGHRMRPSD